MSFQKRFYLGHPPQCVGCETKGIGTALSEGQARKTVRDLKMPLCPRCARIAAEYIAAVRSGKPRERPRLTGVRLLMDYDARIKSSRSGMEIDKLLLELATDADATATIVKAVRGLVKRRRGELTARK